MAPSSTTQNIRFQQRLRQLIYRLNLYTENHDLIESDQILSTRLYLSLLVIGLLILVCFTSVIPQVRIITIDNPSVAKFDDFVQSRGVTPTCRCVQASVVYRDFISFQQVFHHVCSSDFVSQKWISFLFHPNLDDFHPFDFRLSASAQFQVLALLCRYVQQAAKAAMDEFLSSVFISSRTLSRASLLEQVNTILKQMKTETIQKFNSDQHFLSDAIDQHQFISVLRTNFLTRSIPGSGLYQTFAMIYPNVTDLFESSTQTNETCRCDENSHCIYPAAIYNGSDVLIPGQVLNLEALILLVIPGFYIGCTPQNALLQSTLECFYNQSCVDMVLAYSNNHTNISILAINGSSSHFDQNETISTLFYQMMLESWNDRIDYDAYFKVCAPKACSYSIRENFVFAYVLTVLISIFGGLNVTMRILSPVVVQYLYRKCIRRTPTTVIGTIDGPIGDWKEHLRSWVRKVVDQIMKLNVFSKTTLSVTDQIRCTRLYAVVLIVGVVILITYFATARNSQQIVIENPTTKQFEELFSFHRSTLTCPCENVLIPHRAFVSVPANSHPFCSSIFIEEDGFLRYWPFRFHNGTIDHNPPFYSTDFRKYGLNFLKFMKTSCKLLSSVAHQEVESYLSESVFSSEPITEGEFNYTTYTDFTHINWKISSLIQQKYPVLLVNIQRNRLLSFALNNINPTEGLVNDTWMLRYRSAANPNLLGTTSRCYGGMNSYLSVGFYNRSLNNSASSTIVQQIVPGMSASCDILSYTSTSLTCFYSQSCIQMLINSRLLGYEDVYQPVDLSNMTALDIANDNLISLYFPALQVLAYSFIDLRFFTYSYSSYFAACNVQTCSYIREQTTQPIVIVTTVLGLTGGLRVILRLLIPFIFIIGKNFYLYCKRLLCINNTRRVWHLRWNDVWTKVRILNLYQEQNERQYQLLATRLYILLLVSSLIIVSIFLRFQNRSISVTVIAPNVTEYEHLHQRYSESLSCPCTRSSIGYLYLVFIMTSPCYEYFHLNYRNVMSLFSFEDAKLWTDPDWLLLQMQLSSFVQSCSLIASIQSSTISELYSQDMITSDAVDRLTFYTIINATFLSSFEARATDMYNLYEYLSDMHRANQFQNQYMTAWSSEFSSSEENFLIRYRPTQWINDTYCCGIGSSDCARPLVLQDLGWSAGCSVMDGLRQSTFECLYDENCVQKLSDVLQLNFTQMYLNESVYLPNQTIDHILSQMFKSLSYVASNYATYFQMCAPSVCQYSYIETNDALYIVTTLLGLYGGITAALKLIVWYSLSMFRVAFRRCRRAVGPIEHISS